MEKRYYLAYGSNLNVEQMGHRCPTAWPVGYAYLKDWKLSFRGSKTGSYLTIDPCDGYKTPVGVWLVRDSDVRALDRYEGYPDFYERIAMPIVYTDFRSGKNETVTAFVYRMPGNTPIGLPSHRYMTTCLQGYSDFDFQPQYLIDAYRRCAEEVRLEA